jgi:hypothetical protein
MLTLPYIHTQSFSFLCSSARALYAHGKLRVMVSIYKRLVYMGGACVVLVYVDCTCPTPPRTISHSMLTPPWGGRRGWSWHGVETVFFYCNPATSLLFACSHICVNRHNATPNALTHVFANAVVNVGDNALRTPSHTPSYTPSQTPG